MIYEYLTHDRPRRGIVRKQRSSHKNVTVNIAANLHKAGRFSESHKMELGLSALHHTLTVTGASTR